MSQLCQVAIILLAVVSFNAAASEPLRIAVASNFLSTMRELVRQYQAEGVGQPITLSAGSTGKHYAQIMHGAPFDIFFAADSLRPQLLEEQGLIVEGSRHSYALGRLLLWSSQANFVDPKGHVLVGGQYHKLAIANPKLAPYGAAARQVLEQQGLWSERQTKLVRGESVGQTLQFVRSGNAQLGFIAYAQFKQHSHQMQGSYWLVPETLHSPIEQQRVLLKYSPASERFLSFVAGPVGRGIIQRFGYSLP